MTEKTLEEYKQESDEANKVAAEKNKAYFEAKNAAFFNALKTVDESCSEIAEQCKPENLKEIKPIIRNLVKVFYGKEFSIKNAKSAKENANYLGTSAEEIEAALKENKINSEDSAKSKSEIIKMIEGEDSNKQFKQSVWNKFCKLENVESTGESKRDMKYYLKN